MQIAELLRLAEWFDTNIVQNGIATKYIELYNKMNLNVRRNPNQPSVPFEDERKELLKTLKPISFQALSWEQIQFLEKLEIKGLLGQVGTKKLEDVFYENKLDLASATSKISEFSDQINEAQTTIEEIENVLGDLFSVSDEEVPEDSILMRVYFQSDVSINNLADFKKLSATWYDIGRGIAMAQGKSPEDFSIIGAKKGSIIIDMAVTVGLATSVSKILLEALKVADRCIEVLKSVEKLKGLKLDNRKIEQELKKEAEKEKRDGIQSIVGTMVKDLALNVEQQGDKVSAIEKSIKKLVDFTQNGGLVDFVQSDEEDEKHKGVRKEMIKLKTNIKEIRLLENKVKLLESGDKQK